MKKTNFLLTLLIAFIMSTMIFTGTSKAEVIYDSQAPVKDTITRTFNGSERTLILLNNQSKDVWLKVNGSEPSYVTSDPLDIGFDSDGTIWIVAKTHYVYYASVDLDGFSPVTCIMYVWGTNTYGTIITPLYDNDVTNFIFDSQNYVTSYHTSDDIHHTSSISDLKRFRSLYPNGFPEPSETEEPDDPEESPMPTVTPTPNDVVTPRPTQTPVPTTPAGDPSNTNNLQPTTAPLPNTVGNKVKMEKKGTYTYLYKGNTMLAKFRFKSSTLKWTVRTKSGNLKSGTVKKVKSMSVIKKSSNIIYLSKNKRVYIISQKTGKKKLLAKNVKKLVKKGKYAVKIKKANGKYVSVLNK